MYSVPMALVDFVPVVLFGIAAVIDLDDVHVVLRGSNHQRLLNEQTAFLLAFRDELSAYADKVGDKEAGSMAFLRVGKELNSLGCVRAA